MPDKESIHSGHRERLRNLFLEEGLDSFCEINALELLLFYCVPRKDTNDLAHRLLDYFGSYCNVLNAPHAELKKVHGVSDQVATYLNLQGAAVRYYMLKRQNDTKVVKNESQYSELLLPHFIGKANEMVYLLCLDAKCKVLCCREITEGSVNAANISIRKVVDVAISSNATSVVLAHNHPSGVALPSGEDVQTTIMIAKALDAVGVVLVDHIVVADGDYVSMTQSGYYQRRH